jgi:hypothetical protein
MLERHFSPKTLAEVWGMSEEYIRDLFAKEPDVLKFGAEDRNGKKRAYTTLRIPESVAERVYNRLRNP